MVGGWQIVSASVTPSQFEDLLCEACGLVIDRWVVDGKISRRTLTRAELRTMAREVMAVYDDLSASQARKIDTTLQDPRQLSLNV